MALILPFLLILVIGTVEAGLALNRQLTVVNAAREGARFGAFGASADDIHTETLDATSQMFEFTVDNAVVVVIHAETNGDGTGFLAGADGWTETIYPADATVPHVTQGEVLEQLQAEGDAADLKLVVVDVRYDHQSMLGLPFVGALADQIPIGSWTVMRIQSWLLRPTHRSSRGQRQLARRLRKGHRNGGHPHRI
jgi:Flp pilus assembly protein TadG